MCSFFLGCVIRFDNFLSYQLSALGYSYHLTTMTSIVKKKRGFKSTILSFSVSRGLTADSVLVSEVPLCPAAVRHTVDWGLFVASGNQPTNAALVPVTTGPGINHLDCSRGSRRGRASGWPQKNNDFKNGFTSLQTATLQCFLWSEKRTMHALVVADGIVVLQPSVLRVKVLMWRLVYDNARSHSGSQVAQPGC